MKLNGKKNSKRKKSSLETKSLQTDTNQMNQNQLLVGDTGLGKIKTSVESHHTTKLLVRAIFTIHLKITDEFRRKTFSRCAAELPVRTRRHEDQRYCNQIFLELKRRPPGRGISKDEHYPLR